MLFNLNYFFVPLFFGAGLSETASAVLELSSFTAFFTVVFFSTTASFFVSAATVPTCVAADSEFAFFSSSQTIKLFGFSERMN